MNFKIKQIFPQKNIETNHKEVKFDPEFIDIDIKIFNSRMVIHNVPVNTTLGSILIGLNINLDEHEVVVGSGTRVVDINIPISYYCCPGDNCINITITEKTKEHSEIHKCSDCTNEDIDELIEKNSILTLENESLRDEIKSLRADLKRVTEFKDELFQSIVDAYSVLMRPVAEKFINSGGSK